MGEYDAEEESATRREIRQMWHDVTFEYEPVEREGLSAVTEYLSELYVRGGCLIGRFSISENSAFDEYVIQNDHRENDFPNEFLLSDGVVETFPELGLEDGFPIQDGFPAEPVFVRLDPLLLDGMVARLLDVGGAQREFEGTAAYAKALGLEFTDAMFGDRYEDVRVWMWGGPDTITDTLWSEWFGGSIYWNTSFVVLDGRERDIWLFCSTDKEER